MLDSGNPTPQLDGDGDPFAPGFRASDFPFVAVLRRYDLYASDRCDYTCNWQRELETRMAERLKEQGDESDAYLPNPFLNEVIAIYNAALNKRDPHFRRRKIDLCSTQPGDMHPIVSPSERLSISIGAALRSKKQARVGFISSAGTVPYYGKIHLSISNGIEAASILSHLRLFHGFERIYIDIRTTNDRMNSFYKLLLDRQRPELGVAFHFPHFRRVASDRCRDGETFYIKRNLSVPISHVTFRVAERRWWRV